MCRAGASRPALEIIQELFGQLVEKLRADLELAFGEPDRAWAFFAFWERPYFRNRHIATAQDDHFPTLLDSFEIAEEVSLGLM